MPLPPPTPTGCIGHLPNPHHFTTHTYTHTQNTQYTHTHTHEYRESEDVP